MQGKFCHITPVLNQLHWLPVSFHINLRFDFNFQSHLRISTVHINDLVKIKPLNSRYTLQSGDRILLSHPNFKTLTTLDDCAFVALAPKL